ncbi:hypothetical protein GQ457_02G010130 [Hibiscus cannabinus]
MAPFCVHCLSHRNNKRFKSPLKNAKKQKKGGMKNMQANCEKLRVNGEQLNIREEGRQVREKIEGEFEKLDSLSNKLQGPKSSWPSCSKSQRLPSSLITPLLPLSFACSVK